MKILTILGARPQFIKAGNISREIALHKDISEIIIHTGQHYDHNMSAQFFEELKLPTPHYNLGINGKSHGAMTGQMMEKIEDITLKEKPDWILVYGDTNSTLAGALVASKLHIKLAHVEAGLRSFDMNMPEEINRILTDRVSHLLFCPTETAVVNLNNEGFQNFQTKIINSGDIMLDGALFYKKFAKKPPINIDKGYVLTTIHRAENTDNEKVIKDIFKALNELGSEKNVILPLHPRTKNIIETLNIDTSHITIIEPVSYFEMVWLIINSQFIITDSGGLQKESYFFEKNAIIVRDSTEWVELVEHKYNILAGNEYSQIKKALSQIDSLNQNFTSNLYGDGKTANKIVNAILEYK